MKKNQKLKKPRKPATAPKLKVRVLGKKFVEGEKRPEIRQNGIPRPRPSKRDGRLNIAHRVWQIADEISAAKGRKALKQKKKGQPATREEVFKACKAEKISYFNTNNHYYRWRKFNGLFGRVRKDGVLAPMTGGSAKHNKAKDAVIAARIGKVATKPGKVKKKAAKAKKPAPTVKPATKPASKPVSVAPVVVVEPVANEQLPLAVGS